MKEIWNCTLVNPPPNLTYEMKVDRIDAGALSRICHEAVSVLNSQQSLHLEAAMLSRILYRTKVKMRFDKGIMYMSKINRCLLQYLSMDLAAAYNSLNLSEEDELGMVCAPSRQRLEWVLVRTQGFAQLFCHIMKACERAAYYMMCRMHLGHVLDLAFISLGLVSRIWTISKYLVLQSCEWYRLLKPYRVTLQQVGVPWLPDDYEFPEDLISWLQTPLLTVPVILRSKKEDRLRRIFDLINLDEEDDALEEIVPFPEVLSTETITETDDQLEPQKLNIKHTDDNELPETMFFPQTEDIGEPVDLSSVLDFGQSREDPMKKKKKKKKAERRQGTKCVVINNTVSFPSSKKKKMMTEHDEKDENGNSVNMDEFTTEKKKKEVKQELYVTKSCELEQDMLEDMFPILNPSNKKKKKKKELREDVEKVIFNDTLLSPSNKKKRKTEELDKNVDNGISVNTGEFTSKKKQKEEQEPSHDAKTIIKNSEHERDVDKDVFVNTLPNSLKKKKKKKKKDEPEREIVKGDHVKKSEFTKPSIVKQITAFKSVHDLEKFVVNERKSRKNKLEDCVTKCLDKLQWHMFEQAMKGYIQKLTSGDLIERGSEYKRLLKQANKEILIRIQ